MTMSAGGSHTQASVVGVVGLGIMGGAMARRLLAAGHEVVGFDVAAGPLEAFTDAGGTALKDVPAVAGGADVVILSLPSMTAFEDVVSRLAAAPAVRAGTVVDTSTMPLELKLRAHGQLSANGIELLDCPISGTGAHIGDALFFASGDEAALRIAEPILARCAKGVFGLGAFGNGTRVKLIANHLVTIHNASAAEALALARHSGIDPETALHALVAGAGTSGLLEQRGPMMVAGEYEPPTMKVEVFMKDLEIIGNFARTAGVPLPVFAAAVQLNVAALACGWGGADTASVHAVIERLAGA